MNKKPNEKEPAAREGYRATNLKFVVRALKYNRADRLRDRASGAGPIRLARRGRSGESLPAMPSSG